MSEPKTQATDGDVMAFLEQIGDEERRADCLTVLKLMTEAARAPAVMWGTSIVGFGRYRYEYASGQEREWPVIAFSPRKNDLTLYLKPEFEQKAELLAELGKHKSAKSCLYIKKLRDVDIKVLGKLIKRSLKAMEPVRVDL